MRHHLLLILLGFLLAAHTYADSSYCDNLNFSHGNFDNWVGQTWTYSSLGGIYTTSPIATGIITGRQTIISDTSAYDINTGYQLKKIPPGYSYSAQLGSTAIHSLDESLAYTLTVDSMNALFIWKFAVVLQDPNHIPIQQPFFKISLEDAHGNPISSCSEYEVSAAGNIPNFQTYVAPQSVVNTWNEGNSAVDTIVWRNWTAVGANLLPYYGQQVTIKFTAADCTPGGHFGYGYFVAECHSLQITVDYCNSDTVATLTAPDGFSSYVWTTPDNKSISGQTLSIPNPSQGAQYQCTFTSVMKCDVTLSCTIAKYKPIAAFNSYMVDCNSNTVGFNNLSTTTKGALAYSWDFGDGTSSTATTPQHTYLTSGKHKVTLAVSNPPSSCTSILTDTIESFSPPLVGLSSPNDTICQRSNTGILNAHGAWYYQWSTNPTNLQDTTSAQTRLPVGTYWVIGRTKYGGCSSDTIYQTLYSEKDWQCTITGDTLFCQGDSTTLTATGAASYLWNTNLTNKSINVKEGGTYSVVGTDTRGCQRSASLKTEEVPLPSVNLSLSSTNINNKYNQVTYSIPQQPDVNYLWSFGDGTTSTLSSGIHDYIITGESAIDTTSLTATDQYGCTNKSSKIVEEEPFVPNVFTPNGDGHNDYFMPDYEMQLFDRNGILLYTGTINSKGWDGTYNGKKMDPDTYFYILHYVDAMHQLQTKKGYVVLVR